MSGDGFIEKFSPDIANPYALTIFDTENPRSLRNIVWREMQPVIDRAKIVCKDYIPLTERKLRRKVEPDPIDDMLRLRFWQEYDRAQLVGGKMHQKDIIRGLCSIDYFQDQICGDPKKLAWILLPIAGYITRMESSLYIALDEIEDILRLPILNEDGTPNTKLIAEKVKIFQMLDLRVKGAVVQKLAIHQKIDQQVTTSKADPLENMSLTDLEALDRNIQKVRMQIERAQSRELIQLPEKAEVIDIEVGGNSTES